MLKMEVETSTDNTLSDVNSTLLAKVKELLNTTKDRLKKSPHHPLHLQLKEEILDLQLEIDFNGTVNSHCSKHFLIIIIIFFVYIVCF